MNYGDSGLSASDVALLSGNNGRNNDGFGGDGSWAWVLIFLIFAFGGWGRNGYGFGGGTGSGATDNYVLASDFATLQRQMDSGFDRIGNRIENVNNGLCDGFYAMNTGMLNGFSGVQQAMCQGFSGINQAIATNGYETRLGTQNLASQLASCCCDIRQEIADCCCKTQSSIKDVNYNMAMNTNVLQQTLCNNTRDIIENQNANYRAIHEELVANKLEAKNDRIAEQQNEINALRLSASQERQNTYLINQLKPCAEPAYIVPNPNCCYNYGINGYGYNNNCGCNCGNY